MADHQTFAKLAYQTYGRLSAAKNPQQHPAAVRPGPVPGRDDA
jgi:hypothetical protein